MRSLLLSVALHATLLSQAAAGEQPSIERIWLSHRAQRPASIVVNWQSPEPGDAAVEYGTSRELDRVVRLDERTRLHHVQIPIPQRDVTWYYRVRTGEHVSPICSFQGYPTDVLRLAVIADLPGYPPLESLQQEKVHLLLSAGDHVHNVYNAASPELGPSEVYGRLIDRYPDLFRSTPFLPTLGNHDHQAFPRTESPPPEPVYDVRATAYRKFFDLPAPEWRWTFAFPDFSVRLVSVDINHTRDLGTTWQSCHPVGPDSKQFQWYNALTEEAEEDFLITLSNEKVDRTLALADGIWQQPLIRNTCVIVGFQHHGAVDCTEQVPYVNTSVAVTTKQLAPHPGEFSVRESNYTLITCRRDSPALIVELKAVDDGRTLYRTEFSREERVVPMGE